MLGTKDRQDWKVQYRTLLNEVEAKQVNWEALEDELRSAAVRLAIAAMGQDPTIDRSLEAIHRSIKSRSGGSELGTQLEDLSSAVSVHEKNMANHSTVDLSGFVAELGLPHADLHRFIEGLESDQHLSRAQTLKELAGELNRLLEVGSQSEETAEAAVKSVLDRLVQHIREVPALGEAINNFERFIRDGEALDNLDAPLSALAKSITSIIDSLEQDRSELEAFLEQITRQLEQFESWSLWQRDDSQGRKKDSDEFGSNVEKQVDELHADIEASTELGDLKTRVQVRLDSIADQLQDFRDRETERLSEAESRNAVLKDEINRLKVRTSHLAQRCGDQESRLMFDTLTGVHTRYAYDKRLQEEFQRWQRHGQPLVFSIWDIDLFKSVNDNCGHQVGDRLLKVIAGLLQEQSRIEDFVARIGGEEFVVLFPSTQLEPAEMLANRLREMIANAVFHHKDSQMQITVSCGLTEFQEGDTPKTAYERADRALYQAKNSGRNRCVTLQNE